ncbi:methionine ABC transporter permease [Anaerobiospirillum sp. NML120449]|uniref:methionine ABC transporter permease n=1 Tax=Anaerobiospirillum sp. NML120449 TaxID=2932817 RepID=UPI001FF1F617|nr:methionine ABC transporter permease [Anaerobiospirillum sp. NML120449]MCK0526028.1 ABC transporter permease [Anaerobiospirillum sp. NML120449]
MLEETLQILDREFAKAAWETTIMLGISLILGVVFGLICGLVLYLSSHKDFINSKSINSVLGYIINVVRSIPFIILVVFTLPLTFALIGSKIGPIAAAVPLSICAIAFYARLVEGSLKEVDPGVLEAALASGASKSLIVRDVLLVEAAPGLIRGFTVTFISLIGFSAMSGMVGGGGIGNIAILYGYYRYETGVMIFVIVLLVLFVQLVQWLGDKWANGLSR